ncbi:xanthine dehydrogenase family protein molybdopterin-binding subunit [Pseudobacteriovorax antillogorgiicola]|uniref:Xanthine dehydrogenase YagR molybdenum-binding subunit n=1 Tax=Pseudobacteriovorax antillogorgiicola TaxID=1513793 RepID=A0A1Y6CG61_9BACT|nr:xanthine dehydrogenase family protein molybdopterin-binding subunit [Pseudobacteriovorax antillogorgiicola]TCS48726.1 xanthine dehydrogenase YagR molybdenum-binding subunit [Pseudobacteriovorax antillogorgiicola]SMF54486.1 xanthine dehydrogenase YagR molybdenum-binding subunit [Pseudobacteriovorax antillogorgiicola]
MKDTVYEPIKLDGPAGKSITRRSGREKVTGKATFSAEWPMDGLLYATPVVSQISRGRIIRIDSSLAEALPGVYKVLTPENLPSFTRLPASGEGNFSSIVASKVYPVAERDIYYAGQYIAAVIADSFETARDAALLVQVEYESMPSETNIRRAEGSEQPGSVSGAPPTVDEQNAEQVLSAAAVQVDQEYFTEGNYHNPLEPHATIAHWTIKGGKPYLLVYDSSQSLALARQTYAQLFNLDASQIRVVCQYMGGAFGSKGLMWPHSILAVLCSKAVNRPVKLVVSRNQLYGGTGYRTPLIQRVALGASQDGLIEAIIHAGSASTSEVDQYTESFTLVTRMMYQRKALKLEQFQCRLNTQVPTFMRAPAEAGGVFALETAIDELAVKLEVDPVALRIKNEPVKDLFSSKPFSSRHLTTALQEGAKAFGWHRRRKTPRELRDGSWLVGFGVSAATYPSLGFPTQVTLRIGSDGTAKILCCSQEMGTGTATVQAQLLADLLGIPQGRVQMKLGDTDLPAGGISGGSATTGSVGGAVRQAYDKLKERLFELLASDSKLRKVPIDQVQFIDGALVYKNEMARFEDILMDANRDFIDVDGSFSPSFQTSTSNHSFGSQFVEVGVDEDLGLIRVRRMLGCFACGTILNARTARSQFLGGMIMGVGQALQESIRWDHRLGRITNDDFAEYHVPVNADIPEIDVLWIDNPDFNATPIGAKGIGEIGITGVAAAIGNAVYNATGKRLRTLPMTPKEFLSS